MGPTLRIRLLTFAAAAVLCAPCVRAADSTDAPHIRPLQSGVAEFVAEGMSRSQTIRSLVGRLEQSDLVIYVRARPFSSPLTTGHIQFVAATPGRRYVMIEIACGEPWNVQLATLGHELRHAVEIADAPWIRSAPDVEAHYSRIGFISGFESHHDAFETNAAADAGRQVSRELLGNGAAPVMVVSRNVR